MSRHLALLSLLLAAPLAVSVQATAPANADIGARDSVRAKPVVVTLTTTTPWVRKNKTAVLKGRVTGVRGATVTIWQRKLGQRTWKVEARKKASSAGYFTHREDVRTGTRDYRACTQRRCSKPVRVRMGVPPRKATSVSVTSVSSQVVEAGQRFTVAGTASGVDGRSVTVQAYDSGDGYWYSIGDAVVGADIWSAEVSLSTVGKSTPIRARFSGTKDLSPSASGSAYVDVYGWYYLSDGRPPVVSDSSYYFGSYDVNGVVYPKSVGLYGYQGGTVSVEFNLSRACLKLATTVGLQDESATATRSTGRVLADAVTKWSRSNIALGQSHPVSVDVSGALRLRLENIETTSGDGDLVFGDVRVLCAF